MLRKSLVPLIVLLVVCLVPDLFANRFATAETLKFATGFSAKHTMQAKIFEPWAKLIETRTNGRIKITMVSGDVLGRMPVLYDLTEQGIVDICYTLHDYTPGRFPMTEVYSLPFMVPTAEKASRAMWKTYKQFPDFQKEYKNVKLLALFCHPGGDFHTTKTAINSLDDLKGLKIRTATPYVTEALKIFKATPVAIPITETYTALERGVVDGTMAPWEGIGVFRLDDLTRFTLETDFYTMTMMVVMNKEKWKSLPDNVKKIIDDTTGLKMSVAAGKAYDETDQPFEKRAMGKGIRVNKLPPGEMAKLKDLIKPLRNEWIKKCEAKGLDARPVLEASLRSIGKVETSKQVEISNHVETSKQAETTKQPPDDRSDTTLELVKGQRIMVLATSEANDSWAAPVYYVFHEGYFYFFSNPDARHIQQGITTNQTAAAIFFDSKQWGEIYGLQMKGRVEAVKKTDEKISTVERFITKFPSAKNALQTGAGTTGSVSAAGDKIKLYRFVPQTAQYVNNRLGFVKRFAVNLTPLVAQP